MNSIIPISGLQAASNRLANSANNTANQHSTSSLIGGKRVATPYVPTDVTQSSIAPQSGVTSGLRDRTPAETPIYDPTNVNADANGIVNFPNVEPANETVERVLAKNAFMSNLSSLRAELETTDSLLDIAS